MGNNRARVLVPKIVFAFIVLVACFPILKRSAWLDEAMLFSNFPLSSITKIFQPLPYFDQATTPLYSLIMTLVGVLQPELIRVGSVFVITFTLLLVLLKEESSWWKHLLATAIIMAFPNYIIMMSELKHYGLESLGAMIISMWYINKAEDDAFTYTDLFILIAGLVCGISTIIVSTMVISVFFIRKRLALGKIERQEYLLGISFWVLAIGYYFVMRNVTSVQIANYPWTYENRGILNNVAAFASSLKALLGNVMILIISVSLAVLLLFDKSKRTRNILILAGCLAAVLIGVVGLGVYPARNLRHMTWITIFFVIIVYAALSDTNSRDKRLGVLKFVAAFGVLIIAIKKDTRYWTSSFEGAENKQAVQYLCKKAPATIGVWLGGQPVIRYYAKLNPDLKKHRYFGFVNDSSKICPKVSYLEGKELNFEKDRSKPGAWGRASKYFLANNYLPGARSLIAEAPIDSTFYIFASHYTFHDNDPFYIAHINALHSAFKEAECQFDIEKEFVFAVVYKAKCPNRGR